MIKTRWILVPLGTEKDKELFEQFIKEKTDKDIKVGQQYQSGLVMQLVSPDLKRFSQTNIICGMSAFYRTKGINDFLERYEIIKAQEDEIKTGSKDMCISRPKEMKRSGKNSYIIIFQIIMHLRF